MQLSCTRTTMFAGLSVVFAAACGGTDDPLGGPYGGTTPSVSPNEGNVGSVTDGVDASGDDSASGTSGSGGGSSGAGGASSGSGTGSSSGTKSGGSSSGSSSGSKSGSGSGSSGTGSSSGPSSSSSSGGSSSGSSSSGSSSSTGSSSGTAPAAPTWSMIYSEYLSNGSVGGCPRCHGQMGSASGAYSWLSGQRYISGTSSLLVAPGSCLSWYGGTMPPGGTRSDPQAVSDMDAWAAAGAKDN